MFTALIIKSGTYKIFYYIGKQFWGKFSLFKRISEPANAENHT